MFEQNFKVMDKINEISKLGEFGLIDKLTSGFEIKNSSTKKGIGDDAAVLNYEKKQTVVTTDLLIEGVHFNLAYVPLKHLGYKSVAVNLSDICAMNAVPKQITVSIAVSNRFSVVALEELYEGIKLACKFYSVDLIGGDTTSSSKGLLISVTAIGEADADKIVYRNTAKVNDLICVSGNLGGAYAGLQLLERENEIFKHNPKMQPNLSEYNYIVGRQLKPEARTDIVKLLDGINILPTSMIDISDGLSSELFHICKQSGVGCKIFEDKIPIDEQTKLFASELSIVPAIFAMNGGEDYELLFTVKQEEFGKIEPLQDISIIGHTVKDKETKALITKDGKSVRIEAQGWSSFQ